MGYVNYKWSYKWTYYNGAYHSDIKYKCRDYKPKKTRELTPLTNNELTSLCGDDV